MKRWVFVLAAVVVITGCSSHTNGNGIIGRYIEGPKVENAINVGIIPTLLLRHPALDIKPASCGEQVDVGYDSVDTCTVAVAAVTLPITVSDAENPDGFAIKPAGTIVESARASRFVTSQIFAGSGLQAQAVCGSEAVTVLKPDATLTCQVTIPKHRGVTVTVHAEDRATERLALDGPPELTARLHMLDRYRSVGVIPQQAALIAVRAHFLAELDGALVQLHVLHAIQCPRTLDLRGGRYARCMVHMGQGTFWVRINDVEGEGMQLVSEDAVVVMEPLERGLVTATNQQMGPQAGLKVSCAGSGDGIGLFRTGWSIPCYFSKPDTRPFELDVRVENTDGALELERPHSDDQ